MIAVAGAFVGVVFLLSGALKARDPDWSDAAAALGAPAWSIPAVAPFELILGALMVAGIARGQLAILAFFTLGVFTFLILRSLRAGGEAPVCSCFGTLSSKPVSIRSVMRNEVLMVIAGIAAI